MFYQLDKQPHNISDKIFHGIFESCYFEYFILIKVQGMQVNF